FVDGVGAGDDIRNPRGVERLERATVDRALRVRNPEVAVCERLALLGCQRPRAAVPESGHGHLVCSRVPTRRRTATATRGPAHRRGWSGPAAGNGSVFGGTALTTNSRFCTMQANTACTPVGCSGARLSGAASRVRAALPERAPDEERTKSIEIEGGLLGLSHGLHEGRQREELLPDEPHDEVVVVVIEA